ncbi:outer membrane protein assembly factor BamE [Sandarakinorhabdus sp. DWP1-3-1]|uniref:outer membrane protein assembly factor BamE n=1 Tax=Sandarakinorhabdus sp. DWP1-3-1 TaxID=2804627 RepID=UPI003CE7D8C6
MRKPFVLVLVAALAIGAGGCSRIKQNQGYLVDETLLSSIQPGVDNRDSVAKTLGRPTFSAQFDSGEWYYVTRNTGQFAFVKPKVESQSILIVSFDKGGTVTKVERRGMDQIASISPEKDKTPTLGRSEGLLQELFGNLGSVGSGGFGGPNNTNTGRDGPR